MRVPLELLDEVVAIPLGTYTATQTGPEFRAWGATGCLVTLYVKVFGASTVRVSISGKEPFGANFSGGNAQKTVGATGIFYYVLHPLAVPQPAGEAAVTASAGVVQCTGLVLPDVWRLQAVKGDASSWQFGVSVRRLR